MFKVATSSKDKPTEQQTLQQSQETQHVQQPLQLEQLQQTQQQSMTPEVVTMPPQCQAALLGDQQGEINRLTNVATQWSTGEPCRSEHTHLYSPRQWFTHYHSTPNMSPVVQIYNGQYGYRYQQEWQRQSWDRRPESHNRQVNNPGRFFQPSPNYMNNPSFCPGFEGYSARHVLAQSSLNLIKKYNRNDREVTILWLDHIELVAEKMGIDPIKVTINKL